MVQRESAQSVAAPLRGLLILCTRVGGVQGVETALKATAGLKPGSKTVLDAATLEASVPTLGF